MKVKELSFGTINIDGKDYFKDIVVTFQYRQHPWLQDPCHGDSPYFPCSVFRSERAPIGVWNGTLKSECCTVT